MKKRLKNPQVPYQHAASNKISRLLAKCDMKTHHLPVNRTTLEKIGLETPDVCCIPCGCGIVNVRCKGHMKHLILGIQRIWL